MLKWYFLILCSGLVSQTKKLRKSRQERRLTPSSSSNVCQKQKSLLKKTRLIETEEESQLIENCNN